MIIRKESKMNKTLSERFVSARWSKFADPRPKHLDALANNVIDAAHVWHTAPDAPRTGLGLTPTEKANRGLHRSVQSLVDALNDLEA